MAKHRDTAATPRERLINEVDAMCGGTSAPTAAELSDRSALLVACGLVPDRVRAVVLRRIHRGLPMAGVGGFHQLRVVEEQRHEARRILETNPHPVLKMAVRTRLADLDRQYSVMRSVFTRGGGVFAHRVKDIRLDRKNGIYLDAADRGVLFDALASTPTLKPVPLVPRTLGELGTITAARGQREIGRIVLPPRVQAVVDSFPSPPGIRPDRRFLPEMYTALIMEAGALYDRLMAAFIRGGRAVEEVRLQFDAETELVAISADVCRLREAAAASGQSRNSSQNRGQKFTERTGLGPALDEIWEEIIERTVALRELVETVEGHAELAVAEAERLDRIAREHGMRSSTAPYIPTPAEEAAEQLVSGSGDRQLSTEAMRRLRGQLGDTS